MAAAEIANADGEYDSDDLRAKVTSSSNFFSNLGFGLGPILANPFVNLFGFAPTFVIAGSIQAIFSLIYLFFCGWGPGFENTDSATEKLSSD